MEPNFLPSASPRRPWYRRTFVWVLVGLLFFVGVLFWLPGSPPAVPPAALGDVTPWSGATSVPAAPHASDVTSATAPAQGSPAAPIVVVEFGDFQCPYTREAAPIIDQVLKKYPEAVRVEWRNFPLADVHPEAIAAAEAAMCAGQQDKFWAYHNALFANQDALGDSLYQALATNLGLNVGQFNTCRQGHLTLPTLQTDFSAGANAGVPGTPTFFVNGHRFSGVLPLALWDQIVTGVLKAKFGIK